LSLDKNVDAELVRFEASTIVRQTWNQLPEGVSYPVVAMAVPDERASRPFLTYSLNAPAVPRIIQQYAEDKIQPVLSRIPGVYKVDVSGAVPMEWRLTYNQSQLESLGLTLSDLQYAISQHLSVNHLGTGKVEGADGNTRWMRVSLLSDMEKKGLDVSLIEVPLPGNGNFIRLDQLVRVSREESDPTFYNRINGLNLVYIDLQAEDMANQLKLSKKIKSKLAEIENFLPAGYYLTKNYDATEYIQKELNKIYYRTGLTILILLIFVLMVTWSRRYLFLVLISLLANLAMAVIFYYLLGLEMQLYSLTGITISLSLIISGTLVMTDQMLHRQNLKAFPAILASTAITMGSLVVIFFMDESVRLNLGDFSAVVVINLGVSLLTTLFLAPALFDSLGMGKPRHIVKPARKIFGKTPRWLRWKPKRMAARFSRFYEKMILFLIRRRVWAYLLLILAFGVPTYLLPEKIEGENQWAVWYNRVFGSEIYKTKIGPVVDKVLGGTSRLFAEKVSEGYYPGRDEEVELTVYATMPYGATLDQMDYLIQRIEAYLQNFKEIKQFQTSIYNARQANISIYFKKEFERGSFPYVLKSDLISKTQELGGGSWSVYGLDNNGYSNRIYTSAGSYRVLMYGYNYDELYGYAEQFRQKLLSGYARIERVNIGSDFANSLEDYNEFVFDLNQERLAQKNLLPGDLYNTMYSVFANNVSGGSVFVDQSYERLKFYSKQSQDYDIWAMLNYPLRTGQTTFKLGDVAKLTKSQVSQRVVKENQQYRLCLQYDYIGSNTQGERVLKNEIEDFKPQLPVGYSIESDRSRYNFGEDSTQYLLIGLVILIIFFASAILFNSLWQPLAVIFVIPASYIGVFLTFHWFEVGFDDGGFASLILLCGLTVSSFIYILNEWNHLRLTHPGMTPMRAYIKAWNAKIIPILLTTFSTMLGLIPFLIGTYKEAFWFPLAVGTIGGLLMSKIILFFYLPLFTRGLSKKNISNSKVQMIINNGK
ncbi:MAG: efflux RND transporter permease subunit, partial [Bacteroidales bacterium]|nr:efflux RND transporter permease subunit [Bacteroidales bacterium]